MRTVPAGRSVLQATAMARRASLAAVLLVCLSLAFAQGPGLNDNLGTGNPFTNPQARALQFAQDSATRTDFCLGRDVTFGGDTTFESWIYPTKRDGAIFTAVTLDGTGAPYNDDTISFRMINWNLQLFLGGYPIGSTRTNPAEITSVKASSPNMIQASTWTRVFGTVSTSADSTTVCVYALQAGSTNLDGGCINQADIAWPTKARSHLYVGDGSILGINNLNFRGLIENLRIWRKALTPTEILALATVPAADPGVVASWSFDECPVIDGNVPQVLDTSGSQTPVTLSCGNGDATKQPRCARTNSPFVQTGPAETNPPIIGNLGSGLTIKPTPPPTTRPPTTQPRCPRPPDGDWWGDPHFHINGGNEIDFFGDGWFWGARTENWAREQFGFQLFYQRCNGDKTCGAGMAWINKREVGWFKYGEQVGLVQDGNNIAFRGPVMTTPAGTQIEQRGWGNIILTVPGYFTVTGSNDRWEVSMDDSFEGLLPDGTCIPVNDQQAFFRPVAAGDRYYRGASPPPCTDCPVPAALQPPVCPRSAAAGAQCDGPTGVPCTWTARCDCIAQICWDPTVVSVDRRRACLVDTSGTGAFNPQSALASIDATWDDCLRALDVFRAAVANSPQTADYSPYKCYQGQKCPNWCSGPCQGTCNLATGQCTCRPGFGGNDCSRPQSRRRQDFDATNKEIVAKFTSYFPVNAFYAYDPVAKTASKANPVAAPKTASFFLHSQVTPPYVIAGPTLPAGSPAVNSFGIVVNSAASAFGGKLSVNVKLVDAATGAAITGASVSIKDDPADTYTWNAATGSGSFSWTFASGSAGVVLAQLPAQDFCAQITINSATGVDRFVAVSNDESDYSVPILSALPVAAGSSFQVCSAAPSDSCNQIADCGACNARPECGWCASTGVCHRGDETGPFYTTCNVWRSETDPKVSRLVEIKRDSTLDVRTTQLRTYLAPDNAQITVPVEVHIPNTVGSVAFQVRGLFEFTDQMAPFAKFLGASGTAIIDGIQAASPGSLFGVSSFRDKSHVRPHGRAGDWVYKEHVAFQKTDVSASAFAAEFATWASSPSLVADWQFELGLATLEALFHEVHQGWPLHATAGTKNVVLVFTKSPVAQPGIKVSAADSTSVALGQPLPANNLDQTIDDYEDYPALTAVASALLGRGIIPVFVVPDAVGTEEVVASYRSLIAKLGFGKVWPDTAGRNAIKSTMTAAQASAVVTNILADLVTSVQIVASNPEVASTFASPVLFNGDNYPLGAVVRVPITLQRQTAVSRKRDLDTELFRLFYRDRQMATVVGLGQFEVVSTTTDAPSAENKEFSITVDEPYSVAHVLPLPSWSVYDQNMKGYIVAKPTGGAALYNILPGSNPEAKGTPIAASGLIEDVLHRVYIDIPAGAVGDASNGYLYSSFTYKMVDSCGMESSTATVNIRVVPKGMHAPMRYEPSADFLATVNENTKWAPTSTVVCVGGLDYDPQSSISVKITRTPTEGTLYHIVDAKATPGAVVKTGDVVTTTYDARPAPAVGCFVYVPPVRSPGMETPYGPGFGSFQWQLTDDTGLTSAVETTEIDVTPVNYPPVTADATVTGWENEDLNVNLVASDDPRPDGINNNMAVAVKISTLPTRGLLKTKDGVAINAANPSVVLSLTNGVPVSVTYTPDANKHSDVDASGSLAIFDFFTYTATDAGGLSSTASVRVLITPANALPVVQFSNPAWTFPVASTAGAEGPTRVCLAVSNLRDATSTTLYITALPTKGTVSVDGVAASKAPVAIASTSAGVSGNWCFDYAPKKAGTDTLSVKVCAGCPAPTDASFSNYLGGAATQTLTIQNGSQKSASSKGLSKGGVVGVAILGSILGLGLLGLLGFLVYRSSKSSESSGNLKAPLL